MSKLDYVTIGIVAVCIGAIIFLVVKTSRLMSNEEPNRIEDTLGERQSETDTYYDEIPSDTGIRASDALPSGDDPDDDEALSFDPVEGERSEPTPAASTPKSTSRSSAAAKPAPAPKQPVRQEETAARNTPQPRQVSPATSTTPKGGAAAAQSPQGEYMVLAGTFRYESNAEEMVKTLKGLGYREAKVEPFNRGAYAVALVKRFDDLSAARALVEELKTKHKIDARVKKQE